MYTRIFLSMPIALHDDLDIAKYTTSVCAARKICANVVPLFSSVLDKSTGTYGIESGARIDILSDVTDGQLLTLFKDLQTTFSITCVWIDYVGDPPDSADFEYSGCVLQWPYYLEHYSDIGHNKPMGCSEYVDADSRFGRKSREAFDKAFERDLKD